MMDGDQHTHGDPSSTHPEPLQAGEQTSHNVHGTHAVSNQFT